MREEIKKEIIWRYKFIYENIEYIMLPFISYSNLQKEKDFIINKRIPYELLNSGQSFLLSDDKAEFSELVKYVEKRKHDSKYVDDVKKKHFNNQEKERLVWEFFNSICNLIIGQEQNVRVRINKLKTMDEYYRILNYQNKTAAQVQGSKLIANYLKSERVGLGSFIFKRKDVSVLKNSKFTKYVSDNKQYNQDNQGILTEKEKQEIYLIFHEEMAWDTKIKCEIDKDTIYKPRKKHLLRQDINPPCGEEFYVVEHRMFINPKEICYDYYQSCPKCGYVVNIPHNIIPEAVKTRIEDRCLNNSNEFSTMLLSAELRSIDYRDDVLVKRRRK